MEDSELGTPPTGTGSRSGHWPWSRSPTRWAAVRLIEGALWALGALLAAAILNAAQLLRLDLSAQVIIALVVAVVALGYFLFREERRFQRERTSSSASEAQARASLAAALQVPPPIAMEWVRVENVSEALESKEKQVVVPHWFPKGTRVKFAIVSSNNADAGVRFAATNAKPAVISKDHSAAQTISEEGRTDKFEQEFTTEAAGIWYFIAAWPTGNWWGSKITVQVWELQPSTGARLPS